MGRAHRVAPLVEHENRALVQVKPCGQVKSVCMVGQVQGRRAGPPPRRNAAALNWIELTRGGLADSKLRRRAQELALQRWPRGARASAAIYSVTTTAKANGLNPRLYVEWLLTEMPNTGELTDKVVDSFLPWSDRVPES